MSSKHPISVDDAELHAYIDGQLAPQRHEEVKHWLAEHPEQADKVNAYQQQNQAMHALFDQVLSEPLNDNFQTIKSSSELSYWRYAAVASMMIVSGLSGWFLHAHKQADESFSFIVSLPQQAAMAHVVYTPEVLHPVEVSVKQEKHLTNWLSKRLGQQLIIPDLSSLQFDLMGGRLLPGNEGAAAQFMYDNPFGKRLTLYVSKITDKSEETSFRFKQQDKINTFYWIDGSLGYALSGEINRNDLLKAANKAYHTFNL